MDVLGRGPARVLVVSTDGMLQGGLGACWRENNIQQHLGEVEKQPGKQEKRIALAGGSPITGRKLILGTAYAGALGWEGSLGMGKMLMDFGRGEAVPVRKVEEDPQGNRKRKSPGTSRESSAEG